MSIQDLIQVDHITIIKNIKLHDHNSCQCTSSVSHDSLKLPSHGHAWTVTLSFQIFMPQFKRVTKFLKNTTSQFHCIM